MDTSNGQNEPVWAIKAQPILLDLEAKQHKASTDSSSSNGDFKPTKNEFSHNLSDSPSPSSSSQQASSSSPPPPQSSTDSKQAHQQSMEITQSDTNRPQSPEPSRDDSIPVKRVRSVRFSLPEAVSPTSSNEASASSTSMNQAEALPAKVQKQRKPRTPKAATKQRKAGRPRSTQPKANQKEATKIGAKSTKIRKPRQKSTKKLCNNFKLLFQTNKTDFEQRLPTEILCKIFSHVNESEASSLQDLLQLTLVCETWRNAITSTPQIWSRLNLQNYESNFPHHIMQQLSEQKHLFRNVRHLDLSGWSEKNALTILETISKKNDNPKLESLSLSGLKGASWQIFPAIGENSPKLKHLNLSCLINPNIFIRAKMQTMLETVGGTLETLNISCNKIQPIPLHNIFSSCPQLTSLDISNRPGDFYRTFEISIERLQTSCPLLKILRAANVLFIINDSRANFPGFPELEELSIPFGQHNDSVVELLTKNSTKLNYLDIRECNEFTSRSLLKVPSWGIKHLWLSKCRGIESSSTELVFEKWRESLIDLDLSWNTGQQGVDASIRALSEIDPSKSKLKTVNLRGSAISLEPLICLLRNCPKIEWIDLQSCRGMPRGIKREYGGQDFVQFREDLLNDKFTS